MFSHKKYRVSIVIEITKDFNLHSHILLSEIDKSENPPLRISNILRKYKWIGRRSIDQVVYLQSYIDYLMKDYDATTKIIKYSPIVRDDFDILARTEHAVAIPIEAGEQTSP